MTGEWLSKLRLSKCKYQELSWHIHFDGLHISKILKFDDFDFQFVQTPESLIVYFEYPPIEAKLQYSFLFELETDKTSLLTTLKYTKEQVFHEIFGISGALKVRIVGLNRHCESRSQASTVGVMYLSLTDIETYMDLSSKIVPRENLGKEVILSAKEKHDSYFALPQRHSLYGPLNRNTKAGDFQILNYDLHIFYIPKEASPSPLLFFERDQKTEMFFGALSQGEFNNIAHLYDNIQVDGLQYDHLRSYKAGSIVTASYCDRSDVTLEFDNFTMTVAHDTSFNGVLESVRRKYSHCKQIIIHHNGRIINSMNAKSLSKLGTLSVLEITDITPNGLLPLLSVLTIEVCDQRGKISKIEKIMRKEYNARYALEQAKKISHNRYMLCVTMDETGSSIECILDENDILGGRIRVYTSNKPIGISLNDICCNGCQSMRVDIAGKTLGFVVIPKGVTVGKFVEEIAGNINAAVYLAAHGIRVSMSHSRKIYDELSRILLSSRVRNDSHAFIQIENHVC